MKTKKMLKIISIIIVIIIIFFMIMMNKKESTILKKQAQLPNSATMQTQQTEDIYDVILFFGQSNMAGFMSIGIEERYNLTDSNTVKEYSSRTGIDEDIINRSWVTSYTVPLVEPNTVFEYHTLDNSLYDLSDLNEDGYIADGATIEPKKYNGEGLYYDYINNKFFGMWSTGRPSWIKENSYTFSNAYGTNMMNEFAKYYYEKTGHKVVCVNTAQGGQAIANFTPGTIIQDAAGTNIKLYDAMSNKYLNAIKYLQDHNMKIGNKSFVMFQGENEAGHNSSSIISTYKSNFQKIKNQLKQDLGINQGAIVLTGHYPGLYEGVSYAEGVKSIHEAQTQLINENEDIILGSDFPYKHYVPGEEDYNNTELYDYKANMGGVDYDTALENAKLVVGSKYDDNLFHFTSAALSQIGKETAINMYNSMIANIAETTVTLNQNSYIYDGTEKQPEVVVKDGDTTLTKGVDYTISYTNNINAGTAKVIITGKGIYTGSKEISFEIKKAQIEAKISGYTGIYDGTNHGISIEVIKPEEGATIKYGTEEGNYTQTVSPTYTEPGRYTIYYEITAQNYETKTGREQIEISLKTIENANVTLENTEYIYDGTEKQPEVIVKDKDTTLTKGVDYTISYTNNINAGTAKVIITGKGVYTGSKEISFEIKKAQIEAKISGYTGIYDGTNHGISIEVIKPEEGATIKYGTEEGNYTQTVSPTYTEPGRYTIYYEITAENYETKTGSEQIKISLKTIENAKVTLENTEYIYDGTEKQPEVVVKDEDTILTKGVDYTISYTNNINAGTAKVIIAGKGIYTGSKEITFEIEKAQIEAKISGYTGTYDGINHGISIEVIKPEEGATIKYGTEEGNCTQTISPTYTDPGTYTIYYEITAENYETKTGNAQIQIKEKQEEIKPIIEINVNEYTGIYDGTNHGISIEVIKPAEGATIKYATEDGNYILTQTPMYKNAGTYTIYYEITAKGYETKTGSAQIKINKKDISQIKVNLKTTSYIYDGEEKQPEVEVNDGNTILMKDMDYTLKYSNNINIGTATVTIEGKRNYTGIITKEFEIREKKETQKPNEDNITSPTEEDEIDNNKNPEESQKDNSIATGIIPKAGIKKSSIIIGIVITIGISIVCFIKYKKWNI